MRKPRPWEEKNAPHPLHCRCAGASAVVVGGGGATAAVVVVVGVAAEPTVDAARGVSRGASCAGGATGRLLLPKRRRWPSS